MDNQPTLESVAKELNEWRANKTMPQHRIPDKLKESIRSISKHYSYKQMAKTFDIYGTRLKNIISINKNKSNKIKFIELPMSTPKSNPPITDLKALSTNSTTTCTLQHPNGTTMSITLSTQSLASIIRDFVCCN